MKREKSEMEERLSELQILLKDKDSDLSDWNEKVRSDRKELEETIRTQDSDFQQLKTEIKGNKEATESLFAQIKILESTLSEEKEKFEKFKVIFYTFFNF